MRLSAGLTTLIVLTGAPVAGAADQDLILREGAFNSSAACGTCHEEIHEMWRRSIHAAAASDPIFESAYDRAYRETAGEARWLCLRCHAPVAAHSGDLELRDPVSREGVTCDYCHSVASVDLEAGGQAFTVQLDGVKRGPLGDAESPAHDVAESSLHRSAEFCAGCHEYTNPDGLAIISTYSEWKLSPYAVEGKPCQHCHMPLTPGNTVVPALGVTREAINLHAISGGHSAEQVRKAAEMKILSVARKSPTRAEIEVRITNVGSGHCLPTGLPTRKLVLTVVVYCDQLEVKRFERIYQRVLLDAEGQPIEQDHAAILHAASLLHDNRLRAGEQRVERFVAAVPPEGEIHAEVSLAYVYEPQILRREKMAIEIARKTKPRR